MAAFSKCVNISLVCIGPQTATTLLYLHDALGVNQCRLDPNHASHDFPGVLGCWSRQIRAIGLFLYAAGADAGCVTSISASNGPPRNNRPAFFNCPVDSLDICGRKLPIECCGVVANLFGPFGSA